MYKIYINGTPLLLANAIEGSNPPKLDKKNLVARYPGRKKFLLNYVDQLENNTHLESIMLFTKDFEGLIQDVKEVFKLIDAAGGVVQNEKEEWLLIHRRGFWDLPKGKVDPGETIEAAAVREVQEETGVQNIELGEFITKTFHTYRDRKNQRILKRSHWYRMRTTDTELIPQTEEDIELALWMSPEEWRAHPRKVYQNIRDVLEVS